MAYSKPRIKCFDPHALPRRNLTKKGNNPRSFWVCVRLTRENPWRDRFWKTSAFNFFSPHENAKLAFSKPEGLKSILEKLRFWNGLVRTVGLAVRKKLSFQISTVWGYAPCAGHTSDRWKPTGCSQTWSTKTIPLSRSPGMLIFTADPFKGIVVR